MGTQVKTLADLKKGDMLTCAPLMPHLSDEPVYAVVDTPATASSPATVHLYWHDVYLRTETMGKAKPKKKRVVKKTAKESQA